MVYTINELVKLLSKEIPLLINIFNKSIVHCGKRLWKQNKKKEVSMILQLSRRERMVACSEVEVEVVKKKKDSIWYKGYWKWVNGNIKDDSQIFVQNYKKDKISMKWVKEECWKSKLMIEWILRVGFGNDKFEKTNAYNLDECDLKKELETLVMGCTYSYFKNQRS